MKLSVTYDERRQGYFVAGMGFDFFAYFTADIGGSESFIECDSVIRAGDPFELHLIVPLSGVNRLSCDVLETMVLQELSKYWSLK